MAAIKYLDSKLGKKEEKEKKRNSNNHSFNFKSVLYFQNKKLKSKALIFHLQF